MDLYRGNHHGRLAEGDPVPGYVLVALQPEAESVAIPELMPNSLLISNELTVERPLRLGEQVTVQSRLADISERLGGRFGYIDDGETANTQVAIYDYGDCRLICEVRNLASDGEEQAVGVFHDVCLVHRRDLTAPVLARVIEGELHDAFGTRHRYRLDR